MGQRFICDERTVVSTKQGKLRGYSYDGIYTFRGIRYAKAGRFQAPVAPDKWDGVADATSYGYICPILDNPKPQGEVMVPHRFWPENEHCQYLNIWTRSIDPSAKLPVMVWLHGGGYSAGSSIEQVCYEGDQLAAKGDVVLISINHRLNVFGHMDLSMFGDKYKNSVNAGIEDIEAALIWIKENVASFGGDPDNVTIFGQSGGGGKVTTIGQAPSAAGLFHKAIVMSGVIPNWLLTSSADPEKFALALLSELKLSDKEVEKLEKVPVASLKRAVNRVSRSFMIKGEHVDWAPRQNDWYVGDPLQVGFTDYFRKVPTVVGTVLAEFAFGPQPERKQDMDPEARRKVVAAKYGDENADELIRLFKQTYPEKNEVDVCNIDMVFRPISIEYVKRKAAESQAGVYAYQFTQELLLDGGREPWHCSDIPYFFYNTERVPVCQVDGVTERLEAQMASSFINFAKTGDPGAEDMGLPVWTPSTATDVNTMLFQEKPVVKTNYDDELLALLKEKTPPMPPMPVPDEDPDEDAEGGAWFY